MKTLNRFLAQDNSLNYVSSQTAVGIQRKTRAGAMILFRGTHRKHRTLSLNWCLLAKPSKATKIQQSFPCFQPTYWSREQPGCQAVLQRKMANHRISPYNNNASHYIEVAFPLVPLPQMLPS